MFRVICNSNTSREYSISLIVVIIESFSLSSLQVQLFLVNTLGGFSNMCVGVGEVANPKETQFTFSIELQLLLIEAI